MTQPIVQVEDLSFTYPGADAPAVKAMSFEILEGEIFGLLGPSGAGKSTTQKILIKLLQGWSGGIRVFGQPLETWAPAYFDEVGVSFELPNHYLKLTARENLEYFAALYAGREVEPVETVLAWVGLANAIDDRVETFSKGMKNRLNFARSLLHRPRLWFLDEPTSGLDPVTARRIRQVIADRKTAGVTTFLTTHDMHTADVLCDRVGFVVDGALVAVDNPRRLRLQHGRREVEVGFATEGGVETRRFPLDGLADDPAFLDLLRTQSIETLHSQETSLEDVFVDVTGQGLQ